MKTITVVIPCRNEREYIVECIDSIYASVLPESAEIKVFVVDGMSEDGTRELVNQLMLKHSNLYLVDNLKQLTPFAFNLGVSAGGKVDYVQIVGARHVLSSNYLSNCVQRLEQDNSIWCVGGKIINEFTNDTARVISKAMSTSFGMGLGNFRTLEKSGFTDTVTSPMYPFWVLTKIGVFDEELVRNQDDDFNYRVTKEGGKIYYDNAISLKYYVRGNFKGLWRQFFQYGYWKVYVNRKHKTVTTLRQLVPPIFVGYLTLLAISPIVSLCAFQFASIPFVLYTILATAVAVKVVAKDNKVNFFAVLSTFPILHLSYGSGYLKGLWEFVVLRKKPSDKQKRLSR